MSDSSLLFRKLRWRCQRGMLELDLLLIPFVETQFEQLSQPLKDKFIQLLTYDDPVLFAWLMGHESVNEPEMGEVVEVIQAFHRQKK